MRYKNWTKTLRTLLAIALLGGFTAGRANAQYDATEYDKQHWWNPGDWFDDTYNHSLSDDYGQGNQPGYPYDYDYDYGYRYDHDYGAGDYDNDYGYDWDWNSDDGVNFGWHYEWDADDREWDRELGFYDRYYDLDNDEAGLDEGTRTPQYGWHYDWNASQDRWVRDYGWHTDTYERPGTAQRRQSTIGPQDRQYPQNRQNQQDQQPRQNQQVRGQGEQAATLQGTIYSVQRVELKDRNGRAQAHDMVRVRLEKGQSAVVGFRQNNALERLSLNSGDRILVRGHKGTVNGRQVLFANRVRVNGQEFSLGQSDGQQSRMASSRQGSGSDKQANRTATTRTLRGRIANVHELNLADGPRTFLMLRMRDGRNQVVDMGTRLSQQEKQDLLRQADEGDSVVVQGSPAQVQGRNVLRAQRFTIEGREFTAR